MVEPIRTSPVPAPGISELDLAERTIDHSGTVDAASILVAAANKHRTAFWLVNASGVAMNVGLGWAAAVGRGIHLNANGGALELNKSNLFKGDIYIIGASGTGNIFTALELESRYAY